MCYFIFNNKYFQFYVYYTTYCYRHLGRITAIPNGSKLLSFTLIILAVPLLGWLCRLLGWFYSFAFTFTLTCITFNLYYYYYASTSNAVSLPPLWYQSHSFLASDSGVVFSISPSVSTRNFGTPLLCHFMWHKTYSILGSAS